MTFASPSAVTELEHALGQADFDRLLTDAIAVALGPTTARELAARGRAAVVAEDTTLRSLAHTTLRLLQTRPKTWDFPTRDRDARASRTPGAAWCARRA